VNKTRFFFLAMAALIVGAVTTQTQGQNDARALLQTVSKNQGTDNLRTLQYTASGMIAAPGQGYSPNAVGSVPDPWPRFALSNYTMTIDFDTWSSREDYTRTPPAVSRQLYPGLDTWSGGQTGNQSDPAVIRGGGGILNPNPIKFDLRLAGNTAWDIQANGNAARAWSYLNGIDAVEYRKLMIALDPHGFIKAAALPGANPRMVGGDALHLAVGGPAGTQRVVIDFLGKYQVLATVNQNLITDTETWIANPVLGDLRINTSYRRWKDFGGIKFYTDNHPHYFTRPGAEDNAQVRVLDAKANVAIPAGTFAVPAAVQAATRPVVRVESTKLSDMVYLLAGGSHNSVLVEFRDFVAVVEAPLNDERSIAVIAEVKRLVPNKPIRYVVNTHHHWDHSGGLRRYVAEGAQIITHQENIDWYRATMFGPNTWKLMPDTLTKYNDANIFPRNPTFIGVGNRYMLTDRAWGSDTTGRVMEIHNTVGGSPPYSNHDEWNLAVYLPTEKFVINADLYSPPAAGATPPAEPPEGVITLGMLIRNNRLNVLQHVPIHGRPGTQAEFASILKDRFVPDSHGPLILPPATTTSSSQ